MSLPPSWIATGSWPDYAQRSSRLCSFSGFCSWDHPVPSASFARTPSASANFTNSAQRSRTIGPRTLPNCRQASISFPRMRTRIPSPTRLMSTAPKREASTSSARHSRGAATHERCLQAQIHGSTPPDATASRWTLDHDAIPRAVSRGLKPRFQTVLVIPIIASPPGLAGQFR
jgi:hypothetical protein